MKTKERIIMNPLSKKKLAAWILCLGALGASRALADDPTVPVSGTVTDAPGHGWPLFARVQFDAPPAEPVVVYTDPVTGNYATNLPNATAYTVTVTAVGPGYRPTASQITTAGAPLDADWALTASALCDAPGYGAGVYGPPVLSESFDGGVLPPGWSIQTES